MNALDKAYRELAREEAVCRPRIDIQIPTPDSEKIYQWGTMEGGSMSGYFAIRMKSDVIYETGISRSDHPRKILRAARHVLRLDSA